MVINMGRHNFMERTTKLSYPQSFIEKCREVYPTWEDLHKLLDTGSFLVGRLLEMGCGFALDEQQIITLFQNKKENKILEAALRAQKKRALYVEWAGLMDKRSNDHGLS